MESTDLNRALRATRRTADRQIVGAALRPGEKWRVGRVSDTKFVNLDVRTAQVGGGLFHHVFANCTFDRALIGGSKWRSVRFENCVFLGPRTESQFRSYWEDCTFLGCTWQHGEIQATQVVSCTFEECRLSSVSIEECTFTGCSFDAVTLSGEWQTVLFDNCRLRAFDFSAVRFRELSFLQTSIQSEFRTPCFDDSFVVRDLAALQSWIAATAAEEGEQSASLLRSDLEFLQKIGYPICIDPSALTMSAEKKERILQIGRAISAPQQAVPPPPSEVNRQPDHQPDQKA